MLNCWTNMDALTGCGTTFYAQEAYETMEVDNEPGLPQSNTLSCSGTRALSFNFHITKHCKSYKLCYAT